MRIEDYKNNLFLRNIVYSFSLGILSYVLGLISFNVPGLEGSATDLREIPLIASVLCLTNPLYLIIPSFITSFGTQADGLFISTFTMHFGAVLWAWFAIKWLINKEFNNIQIGLLTIPVVLIYYFVFLIPILIITDHLFGININIAFDDYYMKWLESAIFEVTTTSLIVSLFLVQYMARNQLKEHLFKLEDVVKDRTDTLEKTVEELNAANEELMSMNEMLDNRVLERTAELENRNAQLKEYAFVNAHQLRAPLARILGLANLLKMEHDKFRKDPMFSKFVLCCEELDEVVRVLGEMLQENSNLNSEELDLLKDRIRFISNKISQQ